MYVCLSNVRRTVKTLLQKIVVIVGAFKHQLNIMQGNKYFRI